MFFHTNIFFLTVIQGSSVHWALEIRTMDKVGCGQMLKLWPLKSTAWSQTGAMLFSLLKNFGWFVRSFYWARKFPFELPIEFLVTLIRKNVSLWINWQRTFPLPDSEMKAPRALTKISFVPLRRHTLSYPNTHLRVVNCKEEKQCVRVGNAPETQPWNTTTH